MAKKDPPEAGSAAAEFEAEIRANARPMLSEEEMEAEAAKARALECKYAAAKCRDAAAAQLTRAEEYDAQAAELEQGS